jgi:hypothetical protein
VDSEDDVMEIGSRVQINPNAADGYKSPWGNRIRKGLYGTITRKMDFGWQVRLDMPKRAKYIHDWLWGNVRESELIEIERR